MRNLVVFLNTISTCLMISAIALVINHYSKTQASPLPIRIAQIPAPVMKPLPKIQPEHRKTEFKWWRRYSQINHRMNSGPVDLLFLGDSLTQGWNENPTWKVFYGHRNAVNAGIWSDRSQHLLWRLRHGNLGKARPKAVVLLIGGNNLMMETPRKVAGGIKANVDEIRKRLPQTKILVVGILPAGALPNHPRRARAKHVNALLKDVFDHRKNVTFVDIGDRLLTKDGVFPRTVSRDGLHLTRQGYAIFARALEPSLAKLMGERAVVAGRRDLQPTKRVR